MQKNEEIEIKLQITNASSIPPLKKFLASLYQPGSPVLLHMSARYYDTKDALLQQKKLVYRVRRENNIYIATIKGKNLSKDFLARRLEINRKVNTIKPDIKIFSDIPNLAGKINSVYNHSLLPIVTNVFLRYKTNIFFNASKIEAAIDVGNIYGRSKTSPIQELELELKFGEESDVLQLADIIKKKFFFKPSRKSKFSRGLE